MSFPAVRLRRLRRLPLFRKMVRETVLRPEDFVQPFFVRAGRGLRRPIKSMPGCDQLSPDQLLRDVRVLYRSGIPAVILFGIPSTKDPLGSEAWSADGAVQTAVRLLKGALPDLVVMTDLCLCEYTEHGHCGVLKKGKNSRNPVIDNDPTLELLARAAVSQAEAGADLIAPSGMMDGVVKAVRSALDSAGFTETSIMAYSAKYASGFYGPFRDAAESPPRFGDRKTYQMDPSNTREAMREVALDVAEGADIVMVKPALSYLDVIHRVKQRWDLPVAAYNVSGEYAMVKAAARNKWIDEKAVTREILTSIKRAGADLILSYHARDVVKDLK
ncbi:MAG TPA: porphobilinogen synthase [Elusimicrobiota bacterium]|nr:porphobilinogen synthase [Elusimicrobiota bacterium]